MQVSLVVVSEYDGKMMQKGRKENKQRENIGVLDRKNGRPGKELRQLKEQQK